MEPAPTISEPKTAAGTSTLDLALRIVEFLALQSGPVALQDIAREFSASKATVYRHLVTLQRHGFARQEAATGRYEAGVKLVVLGEAQRSRFSVVSTSREESMRLRDATGLAVTVCAVLDGELTVLDLVQGRAIIEFGMRPGTRMDLHSSAHGKIWLAFGPQALIAKVERGGLKPWTPATHASMEALTRDIDAVRRRGWSTAPDEVIIGVNALAAPILDHRNELVGSIAIVGFTQFIPAAPDETKISEVVGSAWRISESLGWRSKQ